MALFLLFEFSCAFQVMFFDISGTVTSQCFYCTGRTRKSAGDLKIYVEALLIAYFDKWLK